MFHVQVRPDFKLLISSATLDAEKFSAYFGHAHIFKFPGRRYPVDIHFTSQPEADYIDASVVTVLQVRVRDLISYFSWVFFLYNMLFIQFAWRFCVPRP
jgi:HrpA-like RNA helicase